MGKGETISNNLPIPRQCRAEQMTNRSHDGNGWPIYVIRITGQMGANKYEENQENSRKIPGDSQALVLLMVS